MDGKHFMVVDLLKRGEKDMFITKDVESISDYGNGSWTVKFYSSQNDYNYSKSRLLYLTDPKSIDIAEKGLYINNILVTNVSEILKFTDGEHTFYHVIYTNGKHDDFEDKDVYITRTSIDNNGSSVWDYLKTIAAETGLLVKNEDDETEDDIITDNNNPNNDDIETDYEEYLNENDEPKNILSAYYEKVDLRRDVPLAQYLGSKKKLLTYAMPQQVIYPFGCNASQKVAVEAALTHQVSIIQGPPGTGKTQTILNIIANLLMTGKTVLVVSNNNSAVENVDEKLQGVNLGFIVAKLGRKENKKTFIKNQPEYPDMSGWLLEKTARIKSLATKSLDSVSQGFNLQVRQAQMKTELNALLTEMKYNEFLNKDIVAPEWLQGIASSTIMKLLCEYKRKFENPRKLKFWFWFHLKWAFIIHRNSQKQEYTIRQFFKQFRKSQFSILNSQLRASYYHARKSELERELESIAASLKSLNIEQNIKNLRSSSLSLLKNKIARLYEEKIEKSKTDNDGKRHKFRIEEIKWDSFRNEYPVILSTTYSARNCLGDFSVFDYVIMDEASQVDIVTGALSLSCATNAVIVGDDKQLPNVVDNEEEQALNAIQTNYKVDDRYNAVTHSFLQSCVEVFKDSPSTLLREHYRCHPKIIEFCNKLFYDGELVPMTTDNGEDKVLKVIRTVPGYHARKCFNQREIDVILLEIMPEYTNSESIGIITPYNQQADCINSALHKDIASTVHKFQGRECDTIILSTVKNTPTDFSDNPNLLNVAISRAKKCLCIVTSGNEIPLDSNIAQLINYIHYNNFEIAESKLHSVFDLLYEQYTAERLKYESMHPSVSSQLSENLIYNLMKNVIDKLHLRNIGIISHYSLSLLIADWSLLDETETEFAKSPHSHVDFLVYNTLTKTPLFTIEVDGWRYHQANEIQRKRDALKDTILNKYCLTPHRISTTQTINEDSMTALFTNRLH